MKPLTDEQVLAFWEVARTVVKVSQDQEETGNGGYVALLNQLYSCGIDLDEFHEFRSIIQDADDAEMRSPK